MAKRRGSLVFVWNYLQWGGAQIYFLGIMKLARHDWDVSVLLPADSDEKLVHFLRDEGIEIEFLAHGADLTPVRSVWKRVGRRVKMIRSEIEIIRRLRRRGLDSSIVHIEAAPWQSAVLLTALSLSGANVFVTFHNALPDVSKVREVIWRIKFAMVSRLPRFHIFTSNEDTRARFRPWLSSRVWDQIKVTYTTVNPVEIDAVLADNTDRATVRKQLGVEPDRFLVLAVGQFIDRKGRWVFLEAARMVVSVDRNVDFIWITSSVLTNDELEKVNEFGLGNRFRLISPDRFGRFRSDLLAVYKAADAFALPSFVEGLPIALLEAMAMGVPSVSTNVYAIPEAIIDEETGLLVEAGDATGLAEALQRLRNDAALRSRLAAAGRRHVITNFDEREASALAIAEYQKCLSEKTRKLADVGAFT